LAYICFQREWLCENVHFIILQVALHP
jgi:hypothetical protein